MAIDVFAGTAPYYARYRAGYPAEMFAAWTRAFGLNGRGRMLDLGCGTGHIALPLHGYFEQVIGIDLNSEMLVEAQRAAAAANVANASWLQLRAEQIGPALGRFRLVTAGSSFHWMDRPLLLRLIYDLLEDGGGLAICGQHASRDGGQPWEHALDQAIERWQNREWRATVDAQHQWGRHEEWLPASPFRRWDMGEVRWMRVVDADAVVGEVFSLSHCNRVSLGDRAEPFAAELRAALLALEPSDRFEQEMVTDYIVVFKD
jgi:ubiquinone/menaquinone biosynthesis C-methylase UbiE